MTSHYVSPDQPGAYGRLSRAVCGKAVNPQIEHSGHPTCPTCARIVAEDDAIAAKILAEDEPVSRRA